MCIRDSLGRVEESAAQFDGAVNGGDGFGLVGWAIELAHPHAAETERRDFQPLLTKLAFFQTCLLYTSVDRITFHRTVGLEL